MNTITLNNGAAVSLEQEGDQFTIVLTHPDAPEEMQRLEACRMIGGHFQPAPFAAFALSPSVLRAIAEFGEELARQPEIARGYALAEAARQTDPELRADLEKRINDFFDERAEQDAKEPEVAKEVVYISGPMSGLPEKNYPAFFAAEETLAALGYEVLNPAKHPEQESWEDFMRLDIQDLLRADRVATLPGYENSRGALLEVYLAKQLGLLVDPVALMPKAGLL